jgi:glycosyltransferase A (GT-A) superfamily protein (DUF2064 family)
MDTPQVTPALLTVGFGDCEAYLGLAEDGGFWALGLAAPDPALLRGVPMSTDRTGAVQHERLLRAGLRVRMLPPLRDVDTAADARAVAEAAPGSRFAAAYNRLATGPERPGPVATGDGRSERAAAGARPVRGEAR